tara:strand:- start:626 stop:2161 length:1536 start_codon:yes stop_codon:yes gene_type:complete
MTEVPEGFEVPDVASYRIKPSASLVATRDGMEGVEILFCHRISQMPTFPDFWAFPGGGVTSFDRDAANELPHLSSDDEGAALAALMREMVEEVGWAPGKSGLVKVGKASRELVVEDGKNWHPLVKNGELETNSSQFKIISLRTTPPITRFRFANHFFHFHDSKPPAPTFPESRSEFDEFRWLTPKHALEAWRKNEMRIPPPQITLLRDMISALERSSGDIEFATSKMSESPSSGEHHIEFAPGVQCVPLPTVTLPPATHTNCYILGEPGGELLVVDPAARDPVGLEYLERRISAAERDGGRVVATIFTHKHPDHIGDLTAISKIYEAPVWATAETLAVIPSCDANRILVDGEKLSISGPSGMINWKVLETPGHCPGHICLSSEVGIISGDLAVMDGTILVPPSDGDMNLYIASLERIRDLKPPILLPAHGPLSPVPEKLLNRYIRHRKSRHSRILDAVKNGVHDISMIAELAYEDSPEAHPILKLDQALSHLRTHERDGNVIQKGINWYLN